MNQQKKAVKQLLGLAQQTVDATKEALLSGQLSCKDAAAVVQSLSAALERFGTTSCGDESFKTLSVVMDDEAKGWSV